MPTPLTLTPSFADFCQFCRQRSRVTVMPSICGHCLSRLPFRPKRIPVSFAELQVILPPLVSKTIVCPFYYTGVVRQSILRMKFSGRWHTARAFGPLLANAVRRQRVKADWIVPVPLHDSRLKQRGFNQAEKLAVFMGSALDLPVCNSWLIRREDTPRQSEAEEAARFRAVLNAFEVPESIRLDNRAVFVVDDVYTTGATLAAAAKTLAAAGAYVQPVVLASNQGKPMI